MNKLGNAGAFLAAIPVIIVLLIMVNAMLGIWHAGSCSEEISNLNNCQASTKSLQADLQKANDDANFYQTQYETLRDYNITKQDFTDIKAQINDLNYALIKISNNLVELDNKTVTIQDIKNTYNLLSLSLVLNIALFPITLFTLIDFVFLNFKYSQKIRKFVVTKIQQIKAIIIKPENGDGSR